jgi:RNA polymerase sigma-70 factor (ECF subfamily)
MPCFSSNERSLGYTELIKRCLDPLHRTAFRLTENTAEAEDLVQETCIRAYRAWAQLREPAGAQAWLFRILRSAWLDHLRKKARRPQLVTMDSQAAQLQPDAPALPDVTDAEERRALEQVFDQEVLAAMNELSEDERLALMFSSLWRVELPRD